MYSVAKLLTILILRLVSLQESSFCYTLWAYLLKYHKNLRFKSIGLGCNSGLKSVEFNCNVKSNNCIYNINHNI